MDLALLGMPSVTRRNSEMKGARGAMRKKRVRRGAYKLNRHTVCTPSQTSARLQPLRPAHVSPHPPRPPLPDVFSPHRPFTLSLPSSPQFPQYPDNAGRSLLVK